MRQVVQKALNRGETYHKLKRAVFHAHQGKFRFPSEATLLLYIAIKPSCSRNAIVILMNPFQALKIGVYQEKPTKNY
jgi:hypothetical protein